MAINVADSVNENAGGIIRGSTDGVTSFADSGDDIVFSGFGGVTNSVGSDSITERGDVCTSTVLALVMFIQQLQAFLKQ